MMTSRDEQNNKFQRSSDKNSPVLSSIASSQNCSTFNPCGSNGYCSNDENGVWQCECKFWWLGTTCDKQSSSGIQVIVLGTICIALIILFHGLAIVSLIRKNRTKKKENKNLIQPNLKEITLVQVKQSTTASSLLTLTFVSMVSIGALIMKWLLLKPIHNELVEKYFHEEDLYYQTNDLCDLTSAKGFNILTLSFSSFILLTFAFLSRRVSFLKNRLNGYIGPVVPLDFYNHVDRKIAIVTFTVAADELLHIAARVLTGDTSSSEGVIFSYLSRIIEVIIIGLRRYPILASVYLDSIISLLCGCFYAWLDVILSIIDDAWCTNDFYPTDRNFIETNGTDLIEYLNYYGTGENLLIIQICSDIPRIICWSYLLVKLPMILIKKLWKKFRMENNDQFSYFSLRREEKIFLYSSSEHSIESIYVRNLFRAKEKRPMSKSLMSRLIPKWIYEWRDDFRFSSRIVCVYSSIFLFLYFITTQSCIQFIPWLGEMTKAIQEHIDLVLSIFYPNTNNNFPLPNFVRPFVLGMLTAFSITIVQMIVLLMNIRRNLFQIQRADHSEIPKRDKSRNVIYSTGNFNFAGFFFGYVIWGYILILFFSLILFICIDAFFTYGSVRLLEKIFAKIIPVILVVLFKQYLNKFLARYIFLQDFGETLALNNRRALMIFLYFNFFLDAFLGFVSSIIRIVKSMIAGCLYMCRLDYSPLGRKLENFDAGFSAYCGFLQLESIHRNPILLLMSSYLYRRMKIKQYVMKNIGILHRDNSGRSKLPSARITQKWHLAILLLRNPSLKSLRKKSLAKLTEETEKLAKLPMKNLRPTVDNSDSVSEIDLRA